MKKTLALAACVVLAFGFASTTFGQAAKKTAEKPAAAAPAPPSGAMMMKPAPEMEKLKWMVGKWNCTGKAMASPMGPEHPTEGEVTGEETLGGMWVLFHYREKKTSQNPTPVMADEYWSYGASGKMWDRVILATGSWAAGTSNGWEKGKIVWTSEGMMGGQKMKFQDTFVEKNPREIHYTSELAGADGKFATGWEITCKK